jgi:hypothetical protein
MKTQTEIQKSYTNGELNILKEAVYKIADAQSMIKDLCESMKATKHWRGLGDATRLKDELIAICNEGGATYFLKEL